MEIKEIKKFAKRCVEEDSWSILLDSIGEEVYKKVGYSMIGHTIITDDTSIRCLLSILPDEEEVHKIEQNISKLIK